MQTCPAIDDFYWVNMRIGLCRQSLRDYPGAIRAFRASLQRGKKTGERVKMGWSLVNLGDTLLLQGNASEAKHHLEQALDLFQKVGTTVGILWSNYSLSRAALNLRNPARAREFAETAGQIARQIHSGSWIRRTGDLLRQIDPQLHGVSANAAQHEDETFSPRELEVLQLLKSELSGPEIAGRLVVSLNTVRYHTKNIYRKLGANTRLEAIERAKELGL
jgi:ATP/maltotriose-dependent transcriptional regulator MalT